MMFKNETAGRGPRIERIGHADQRDTAALETLQELGQVGDGACEAIQLRDDDRVQAASVHQDQQPRHGRPLQGLRRLARVNQDVHELGALRKTRGPRQPPPTARLERDAGQSRR